MARVLITGGSGYFGSLLLRKLIDRGHECTVLDINDAGDRPKSVDFIQADIRDDDAVYPGIKIFDFFFEGSRYCKYEDYKGPEKYEGL